jgi:hypothetical protein
MINLSVSKGEKGLYMSFSGYWSTTPAYIINGKTLTATWKDKWYYLEGEQEVKTIQTHTAKKAVNHRWELLEKVDREAFPMLPEFVSQKESCEYYCDEGDELYRFGCNSEYHMFNNMYERVFDYEDGSLESQEFEVKHLKDVKESAVDTIEDYQKEQDDLDTEDFKRNLSALVNYDHLASMIKHPLEIHNYPCQISSEQSYKIIRSYVKGHIDTTKASVTSDYDFCFTINKIIEVKPYTVSRELKKQNGRSYAKPRFNTRQISKESVELFEMTHAGHNYKGYTCLKPFKGNSLADLTENVRLFLEELMLRVNEKSTKCEHCNGHGVNIG